MRKPYRQRRVSAPPEFQFFKPSGIPRRELQTITLSIDEYEAIRLADHRGLEHKEAAQKMNISRPTFTRLIEKARKKVAIAIVDGMELAIQGGNVDFVKNHHRCRNCGETHTTKAREIVDECPDCGSTNVEDVAKKYMNDEEKQN